MEEIVQKEGFLPAATWLIACQDRCGGRLEYCGTIQGIRDERGYGSVQNVGITPEHRGQGLGTRLVYQSLLGFQSAGLGRVYLEVTAENRGAVRLYQRLGFRKVRTVYKVLEETCTG
jgi:ribosomal protein S18 acetylase RimI-like enzyme